MFSTGALRALASTNGKAYHLVRRAPVSENAVSRDLSRSGAMIRSTKRVHPESAFSSKRGKITDNVIEHRTKADHLLASSYHWFPGVALSYCAIWVLVAYSAAGLVWYDLLAPVF